MQFKTKLFKWMYKKTNRSVMSLDLNKVKKVLIIREDSIGDLVVTTPFIRGLEQFFPHWDVTVLVSDRNQSLLKYETSLRKIVVPFRENGFSLFLRLFKYRKEDFDLIVDPFEQRISRSYLIFNALKPKHIIGFAKKEKYGLVPEDFELIEIQYKLDHQLTFFENFRIFLNQLTNQNLPPQVYRDLGRIDLPVEVEIKATNFLKKLVGRKTIFFNIDGSKDERTLSAEAVKEISQKLSKHANIIISAAPKNLKKLKESLDFINNSHVRFMYEGASILDVVAIIKCSDYVVSVDTVAVHIASLFNKPILGIYTRDKGRRKIQRDVMFDPYSNLSAVVYSPEFLNAINSSEAKALSNKINLEFLSLVEQEPK